MSVKYHVIFFRKTTFLRIYYNSKNYIRILFFIIYLVFAQ